MRFEGNSATVLEHSRPLLEQLSAVMREHPSICVRLEGHTNSKCGTDCDGTAVCANNRCATSFGQAGGALAFSLSRADGVKLWLEEHGVEADRVLTMGLAGSRRIEDDTEGRANKLNRRVEVHTLLD